VIVFRVGFGRCGRVAFERCGRVSGRGFGPVKGGLTGRLGGGLTGRLGGGLTGRLHGGLSSGLSSPSRRVGRPLPIVGGHLRVPPVSTTQVSLLPPPWDELTTRDPGWRATRVRPPRVT
jgi:hypothetical protein